MKWKVLIAEIVVLFVLPLTVSESKEPALPLVHQILRETGEASAGLRTDLEFELLCHIAFLQAVANDRASARTTVEHAKAMILDAQEWIQDNNDMLRVVPYLLALAVTEGKLGDETGQALSFKQAKSLVEAASDGEKKLEAIGEIASAYIKVGDIQRAMQTLAWAIRVVEHDVKESRKDVIVKVKLWNLAEPLVEYGYPKQAVRMIWDIVESMNKNISQYHVHSSYKRVGKVLAKTKDVKALRAFIKMWKEQKGAFPNKFPGDDIRDLLWLSEIFLEAGDQPTATQYLAQAQTRVEKDNAFSLPLIEDHTRLDIEGIYFTSARIWRRIAIQEARLGNLKGAREAEGHIPLSWEKGRSGFFIAETQLQKGDILGARQTARIEDPYELGLIVAAQARHGDVEGAIESFEHLEYLLDSNSVLQDALARLQSTEYPPSFLEASHAVAKARIIAGDVEETIAWARGQPTPYKKTYALVGIAEGLLEKQQGEKVPMPDKEFFHDYRR